MDKNGKVDCDFVFGFFFFIVSLDEGFVNGMV